MILDVFSCCNLLTSSERVHQCRMCGCRRCIGLWFGFAHFRVTLGEFQAYSLGHIRIEAYTLLQMSGIADILNWNYWILVYIFFVLEFFFNRFALIFYYFIWKKCLFEFDWNDLVSKPCVNFSMFFFVFASRKLKLMGVMIHCATKPFPDSRHLCVKCACIAWREKKLFYEIRYLQD